MEVQNQIGLFVGMAWFAMLLLTCAIIIFYQIYKTNVLKKGQRIQAIEREKQIAVFKASSSSEEKQKRRIAENLHDEIIPQLSVLGRNIEQLIDELVNTPYKEKLLKDKLLVEQVVAGIKEISFELIPKVLLNHGLIKAIENTVRQLNESNGSRIELINRTNFRKELPFTKDDQVQIFRMCLELLNNLNKHSSFTYLRLTIDSSDHHFMIEFMHDGTGITNEKIAILSESSEGLGLKSLKSRQIILNAEINYLVENDSSKINMKVPYYS